MDLYRPKQPSIFMPEFIFSLKTRYISTYKVQFNYYMYMQICVERLCMYIILEERKGTYPINLAIKQISITPPLNASH